MCLDNIEEIAAAVEAAKKAKDDSAFFEQKAASAEANDECQVAIEGMTFHVSEIRLIHTRRIEAAESKLRDLGFRGPVVKATPADPGDAQRTLASNRTGENR